MDNSMSIQQSTSTAISNGGQLSGKLIIKAQLGDDIRKLMIHNEDLTLNELVLMMERVFTGKISNSDEITIKYLDDDGDKITLLNDSDLTVALHFHKTLRLFVLVNGNEQVLSNPVNNINKEGSLIDATVFRAELQQIRNSVQTILDRLQLPTNQEITDKQNQVTTATVKAPTPSFVQNTAREFDPYKHLQTQRSTTPDSIHSRTSNSNKTAANEIKQFPTTSTGDTQQQSTESNEANRPVHTYFQTAQMPAPTFSSTLNNEQQNRISSSPFGAPPLSTPGMPPQSNSMMPRFPTSFPTQPLPNVNAPPTFNTGSVPPPPSSTSNTGPTSTFIGQQNPPQAFSPVAPPPIGGFYGSQNFAAPPKSYMPGHNLNTNTSNTFTQPQAPPPSTLNSSPATINPSFVQPTAMPAPPPLASQQPYAGYTQPNNFYSPAQPFAKMS